MNDHSESGVGRVVNVVVRGASLQSFLLKVAKIIFFRFGVSELYPWTRRIIRTLDGRWWTCWRQIRNTAVTYITTTQSKVALSDESVNTNNDGAVPFDNGTREGAEDQVPSSARLRQQGSQ